MVFQHLLGFLVDTVQQLLDLVVHLGGGLLGAVQVSLAIQVTIGDGGGSHQAQLVAHAVEGDHVPGQTGGPLDVVGGAGGLDAEDHGLSGTAANQGPQLGHQLLSGVQELLLLGHLHGVTQSAGGVGNDGNLGNGLGVLLQRRHQSVAHLMVSDQTLFHIGEDGVLLLGTGDDGLKGDQQVLLGHELAALADSPEGGLVDQVCQVSAHGTGGGLGQLLQVHVLAHADLSGMDLQGLQTALEVGTVHDDPAVETAGTEQGLVQDLRTVGGRQANDALGGLEAVDLAQQGVQGLVIGAQTLVTLMAHGVDLIDEDDAGGNLGGFLEEVTDTAGADAHEGVLKVGTGDGEEGNVRFARHGLGKQRLTGARRADQQSALGQLCADLGVFLRGVEEIDDLLQGFLGLVLTGNILEGHAGGLFHVDLGLGLAHAAQSTVAARALGHHHHEDGEQGDHTQGRQHRHQNGLVFHDELVTDDAFCVELFQQLHGVGAGGQARVADLLLVGILGGLFLGQVEDAVGPELDLRQLTGQLGVQEIGEGLLLVLAAIDHIADHECQQCCGQRNHHRQKPFGLLHVGCAGSFVIGRIFGIHIHY